jgi:hypothetical protein
VRSPVGPSDRPLRRSDHSPKLRPDPQAQPACIGDAPAEQAAGALGLSRTRFYTLMRRYRLS